MEPWKEPDWLARQYGPAVYRLAFARTGSRADAEDVMQEVFVRLLKVRPDFADREHAKAWLLRVAANCANDLFRAPWRRREEPLSETLSASEGPEPGGVAEIAAILGKSEGAVKSRLFRARALLREWMKEDEDVSHGV